MILDLGAVGKGVRIGRRLREDYDLMRFDECGREKGSSTHLISAAEAFLAARVPLLRCFSIDVKSCAFFPPGPDEDVRNTEFADDQILQGHNLGCNRVFHTTIHGAGCSKPSSEFKGNRKEQTLRALPSSHCVTVKQPHRPKPYLCFAGKANASMPSVTSSSLQIMRRKMVAAPGARVVPNLPKPKAR